MFINEMNIEKFGLFEKKTLVLSSGLNVIHGPNEAGKSAMRAFVRNTLFGFLPRSSKEFDLYNYPPRGGVASGRISFTMADEREFTVGRVQGPKGGQVEVWGSQSGSDELLDRLLGRCSVDVYQSVFSISLRELQDRKFLSKDQVRDQLNSASLGLSRVNLADRIEVLNKELSSPAGLWSPAAGSLRRAFNDRNNKEAKLRDAREQRSTYGDLTDQVKRLQGESGSLADLIAAARAKLVQLSSLGRLRKKETDLLGEIRDGKDKDAGRALQVKNLQINSDFSNKSVTVRDLISRQQEYILAIKDLPDVAKELFAEEAALKTGLAGVGEDWDEAAVESFDENKVQKADTALASAAECVKSCRTKADDKSKVLSDSRKEVDKSELELKIAREALERFGEPPDLAEDLKRKMGRLTNLESALAEMDQLQQQELIQQAVTGKSGWGILLLATIGTAGIATGLVFGELSGLVIGIAAVISAGVLTVQQIRRDRTKPSTPDRGEANLAHKLTQTRENTLRDIKILCDDLEMTNVPPKRDVVEQATKLRRLLEKRNDFDRLDNTKENTVFEIGIIEKRMAKEKKEADAAIAQLKAAEQSWSESLQRYSLDKSLSEKEAVAALGKINTLREQSKRLQETRGRVAAMEASITDIESKLSTLCDLLPIVKVDHLKAKPALEELQTIFDKHNEDVGRKASIIEVREGWPITEAKLSADLEETRQQINHLFVSLKARNNDSSAGEVIHSPALQVEKVDVLQDLSPEEAQADQQILKTYIEEQQSKVNAKNISIGTAKEQQQKLEEDNPVTETQEDLNRIDEQVKEKAKRWALLTIAEHVIEATREKFQKERQTPLLQSAQSNFENFTLGRYKRVSAILGKDQIQAEDTSEGHMKDVAELSTGTREQLLLALRLAMIREYARNFELLPILMDDVMVNFDPERALAVCGGLVELSKTHQVIVLTCQSQTVDQFEESASNLAAAMPTIITL